MKKLKMVLATLFLGGVLYAQPNLQWQKNFGGSGSDTAYSIKQTSDGGYIVAGQSRSADGDGVGNHGGIDYLVLKLDAAGNVTWKKSYGGSGDDIAQDIIQTPDGGYIIAGNTISFDGDVQDHGRSYIERRDGVIIYLGPEVFEPWILKLDVTGNITWQRSLHLGYSVISEIHYVNNYANKIIPTFDGNYLVGGNTPPLEGDLFASVGFGNIVLTKLSPNGDILSGQKVYWGDKQTLTGVFETGSGYVTAGHGSFFDAHSYKRDMFIAKSDFNGNFVWGYEYGGIDDDKAFAMQRTADSGYILVGTGASTDGNMANGGNHGGNDFCVIRVDSMGVLVWAKYYGGSGEDIANAVQLTSDGGFLIAGSTTSSDGQVTGHSAPAGQSDYWLIKVDSAGNLIWNKSYGGSGNDGAFALIKTADDAFVMAGNAASTDAGFTSKGADDFWLLKFNTTPPAGCTTPTLSAAITSVSCKGGSTGGIVLTTSGGSSPFTYAWTGPNAFTAITKDITNVKAGLYNVKVTATGGCYFNASYRVSEPLAPLTINLAQGVITCYGGTTNVGVYGSGGTTPYTGTGVFSNKTAGIYTYTITDAKGCSSTGSITVVQPAAIVSSVVINPVSCKGTSTGGIDLSVSGGVGNFTYAWTGPNGFTATSQDIVNVSGGLYSVRVGSGQCYTNATYRVTEPLAPLGASISASTIVCAGGTTNVYISPSGGTTPYTGGGNIPNQSAGPHSYTVTDARGCTFLVSINISAGTGAKPATPVITGPSNVTPNQANVQFTASASGASGYTWVVPAGASITSGQGTNSIRVQFGTSGGQVQVTATNNCGSSAQVGKTVSIGSARLITKTIVAPLTTAQYFTTSPNPAQGMVTVKFSAAKSDRKFEIKVSDVSGKTIFTKSGLTTAGDNMLRLDMTRYSSSLYFITLISDDQLQTQKLIKAK